MCVFMCIYACVWRQEVTPQELSTLIYWDRVPHIYSFLNVSLRITFRSLCLYGKHFIN